MEGTQPVPGGQAHGGFGFQKTKDHVLPETCSCRTLDGTVRSSCASVGGTGRGWETQMSQSGEAPAEQDGLGSGSSSATCWLCDLEKVA